MTAPTLARLLARRQGPADAIRDELRARRVAAAVAAAQERRDGDETAAAGMEEA